MSSTFAQGKDYLLSPSFLLEPKEIFSKNIAKIGHKVKVRYYSKSNLIGYSGIV